MAYSGHLDVRMPGVRVTTGVTKKDISAQQRRLPLSPLQQRERLLLDTVPDPKSLEAKSDLRKPLPHIVPPAPNQQGLSW